MEQRSVHKVLATSYLTYYVLCTVGLFADMLFPLKLTVPGYTTLSSICFVLGPFLIVWAQYTSYHFEKIKEKTGQFIFQRGPYRILRNPTQLGLLILVTGYALATGAVFLFLSTILSYSISNIFFKKHEQILEARYGDEYRSYKEKVKKVL